MEKTTGKDCGRDANGVFCCKCEKCRVLSDDQSHDRRNSSDNSCETTLRKIVREETNRIALDTR